jgi:serine protease Do
MLPSPARFAGALVLAAAILAGCDDPAPAPPPPPPASGASATPPAAPVQDASGARGMRLMPDFEELAAQVMPAVVSIAVTQEAAADLPPEIRGTPLERHFRDRYRGRDQPQVQGAGSGFIIDPSGIIVTNNHVAGSATRVVVSLLDGTELPARLLGTDELTDIAVLQVQAGRPLPHVALGDSDALRIGQWVLAAGNPFGLGGSVTSGIVSALGRNIGAGPLDDFIQTDAAINPGNSGGPLFNLAGEVAGISTAIYSPSGGSAGIGFATPATLVRPVIAKLVAGEPVRRGWLGVAMADQPGARPPGAPHGALLAHVLPNGPAARAGLRDGDVITALDGEPVPGTREIVRRVAAMTPGQRARLTVLRDGRERQVEVEVAARPPTPRQG